jgi:hypothetical protein
MEAKMVPSTQRPPLETTKTSQPQPVRNEEQRSHLKNSDGQYHNITTVAMKGTSLKMATRGNIRVIYQRILAKKPLEGRDLEICNLCHLLFPSPIFLLIQVTLMILLEGFLVQTNDRSN